MWTKAERRQAHLRSMRPFDLRGANLRYCLLTILEEERSAVSIDRLIWRLERLGLRVGGTNPHKTVSDVLRYEVGLGRVERVARGTYRIGRPRPQTTVWRHRQRLRDLVAEGRRRGTGEADSARWWVG